MSSGKFSYQAMVEAQGAKPEFRIDHPLAIRDVMRALHDAAVPVQLYAGVGTSLATTVWTYDSDREVVHFSIEEFDPDLSTLLADSDVLAIAHIDDVKVQFELGDLVLVRGESTATLRAPFPGSVYRFQRRSTYRVKSTGRSAPVARMRHPQLPDMQLELRVLDVSLTGCALLLPANVPPMEPGTLFNRVQIDLDPLTRLDTGLRLHHVTVMPHRSQGSRLGCSLAGLAGDSLRALQRYVNQAQRKRRPDTSH